MTNYARALFSSNAAEERVELLWDRRGIDLISDALPAVQMETSHCLSHGLVQIPGGIFHVNTSDRNQPADFADWSKRARRRSFDVRGFRDRPNQFGSVGATKPISDPAGHILCAYRPSTHCCTVSQGHRQRSDCLTVAVGPGIIRRVIVIES